MLKVKSINEILGDPERTQEVVIVLKDLQNRILLISKKFYPKGIYRLPGGGIESDETPEQAVRREAKEEFGRNLTEVKSLGLLEYKISDSTKQILFKSYLFLVKTDKKVDLAEDTEHSEHKWVKVADLPKYIETFRDIPKEEGKKDWKDWGRFRVIVFEQVYKILKST